MNPKSHRQAALDIQIGVLQQELVQLKRERNELSPISALPIDILRTIFSFSLQPLFLGRSWKGSPDYVQLCHIFHAWRVIALESPELWTCMQIRAQVKPKLLDFQLKNTKEALLDIEYCDSSGSGSQLDVVSRIIREQAEKRLKSLKIYATETQISQLLQGTNERAEMLEDLFIYDLKPRKSESGGIREDIFAGSLPKLLRLRSNRVLPWTSSLLTSPNLTELSMGFDHFDECRITRSSMQQLLAFLSRSPQLKSLALVFSPTGGQIMGEAAIWTPIKLPSLEALRIEAADSEPIAHLLPLLLLDQQIHSVYFGLTQASGKAEVLKASAASNHLLNHFSSPQQLYITSKDNRCRGMEMKAWRYSTFAGQYKAAGEPTMESEPFATFSVSPFNYNLHSPGYLLADPREFDLDWWVSNIRTVVIHSTYLTTAFWTVLAARPALQFLSFILPEHGMGSAFFDVLQGTKCQDGVEDNAGSIPFPALRSLYIGTQHSAGEEAQQNVRKYTLDALEGRKSVLSHRELGQHPLDLQELAFVNCTNVARREDLESFLSVAGKAVWRLKSEMGAPNALAQDVAVMRE